MKNRFPVIICGKLPLGVMLNDATQQNAERKDFAAALYEATLRGWGLMAGPLHPTPAIPHKMNNSK